MPPSAITGTPASRATSATLAIAETCGTPTPATILVVQMEPGPMPTFSPSTESTRAPAACLVAMFPATTSMATLALISLTALTTFMLWP
ncbi:hypothetical protein DSECCO2_573810 [anaerobic digester metagenome]